MRTRSTLAGAAAAAALALSSATLADEHPIIGTWTGTWPSGLDVELTVTEVDADRAVRGLYCNMRKTHIRWWDLHPDQIEAKLDRRGRLKFGFNKIRWEYRPAKRDPDTLKLTWKKGSKRHKLDMTRVDPGDAACRSRVATLDEGAIRTTAPTGDHPLVGTWAGDWPGRDSTTEIAVDEINGDQVVGTYCHRRGLQRSIYDLHPTSITAATVEGETITFTTATTPHPSVWRFTPKDEEALHLAFTAHTGDEYTLDMQRVEPGQSACINRVTRP